MSKLSAGQRDEMPQASFGLPGKRFPLNDPTHDRMALSGATRSERAGNISPGQAAQVKTEARAKLGAPHPRDHALTLASASHLHNKGLISTEHHAAIRKHAQKGLAVHKASKPAPYGSMAPQSAGHYLSTVNPGAAMDDQGGGW